MKRYFLFAQSLCYGHFFALERKTVAILLVIFMIFSNDIYSQSGRPIDYQIILENKVGANILYRHSKVNPNNYLAIDDVQSASQFYPILKFDDSLDRDISANLRLEGEVNINNFIRDSLSFSFLEMYGQLSSKYKHYFIFGKKRLDWGIGLVWNPTLFYTQKDPLRNINRLEGIFMLNYEYVFQQGALSFYIFPENSIEESKVALKYDFTGTQVDASLSYLTYGQGNQVGYEISYGGSYFTAYLEGVFRNFSRSYEITSDGLIVQPNRSGTKYIPEVVFGSSIILNSRTTLFTEYRYRNDYLDKGQIINFKDNLPNSMMLYDPISVSKHSIFNSIEYRDMYGRWSLNLRNFYDPISNQLLISPLYFLTKNGFQMELSVTMYNRPLAIHRFQSTLLFRITF